MNFAYIGRVIGAWFVALGLLIGLFAQTANAQVAMTNPAPQIQSGNPGTDSTRETSTPASSNQVGTASACGWDSPYYRHCGGQQWILVRVVFSYGLRGTEDIWVTWGQTDLVWRYRNHAGSITNAYCVLRC